MADSKPDDSLQRWNYATQALCIIFMALFFFMRMYTRIAIHNGFGREDCEWFETGLNDIWTCCTYWFAGACLGAWVRSWILALSILHRSGEILTTRGLRQVLGVGYSAIALTSKSYTLFRFRRNDKRQNLTNQKWADLEEDCTWMMLLQRISFHSKRYGSQISLSCSIQLSLTKDIATSTDRLCHHGHVRTNGLPHKALYSLDHDPRLQALSQGRYFHLRLSRAYVGLLHSCCHCEDTNLQAHFSLLGLWKLSGRIVPKPASHYHGRCCRQRG